MAAPFERLPRQVETGESAKPAEVIGHRLSPSMEWALWPRAISCFLCRGRGWPRALYCKVDASPVIVLKALIRKAFAETRRARNLDFQKCGMNASGNP
ncbi:hypothetical protein [Paraburkholderia sp. J67]|uniref:hypothetical protein n=1 Tax=Paraburkholderia sp. J67 TaxID=2805435 RepID=UPI002ABD843F|nr:hypothetical protein [Paraburkholderia sp. J67]